MSNLSLAHPRWRWCHFDSLGVHELAAIYRARQHVFAIEQQCIYQDIDGADGASFHLAVGSPGTELEFAL